MSDEDIVRRILAADDDDERQRLGGVLFGRYYSDFDQWVRAVLATYGKAYSDQQRYYEEVFLRIHGQVFDPPVMPKVFRTYDPSRGRFGPWLQTVVRNKAIDWVRGQKAAPLEMTAEEDRQWASRPAAPDAPRLTPLAERLASLPDDQRLTVRLMLIAYLDMTSEDIRALCDRRGEPREAIERDVGALRGRLQVLPKYGRSLQAEDGLDVLRYQVSVYERRSGEARERLVGSGVNASAVVRLEDEARTLSISELSRNGPLDGEMQDPSQRALAAEYQEALVRLRRLRAQWEQQRDAVRAGKHLVRTSYREIARVMGVKETDVTNYLHRARERIAGESGA